MRSPPLPVLSLLLLGLSSCNGAGTIIIDLAVAGTDAFQGVTLVRLSASGPPPMGTLFRTEPVTAAEVSLDQTIPYGPNRRILVEGLDGTQFLLSRGESEPFEVTADGPERVMVPFGRCNQELHADIDNDGVGGSGPGRNGCVQSGWAVGNDDCDDTDRDAHPRQTQFFTRQRRTGGFDFNCNGTDELEQTAVISACEGACKGVGWAVSAPRCGETGQFVICVKEGGSCLSKTEQRVQACR